MSIIKSYDEGKTQLNKLKFQPSMGNNHPGKPPLITRPIPSDPSSSTSPDPRSGAERRIDDVSRIAQLFARKEGLTLLAKNATLQASKELSYKSSSNLKSKLNTLKSGLVSTAAFLGSTLAQVGVAGTGTHFVKSFGVGIGKRYRNSSITDQSNATYQQGNPGAVYVRYGDDVNKINGVAFDLINLEAPTKEENPNLKDYIKFYFEVLEPENILDNGETDKTFLYFRAYLDSFNDNFNGSWNSFNYVGRGESFYTYSGFSRDINFSFKIAAQTKQELLPLYEKIKHLAATTAPSYSESGFMRGTLTKVTIGTYLKRMPGFINSVGLSWDSSYPWEIEGDELPTVLNVNVSFTVIHNFTPQSLKLDSTEDSFDGRALGYIRDAKPAPVEVGEGKMGEAALSEFKS